MKVLSLFDGISAAQVALQKNNIDVEMYYASEIDKYAIQVTQKNFPSTYQLGDIKKWRDWDIDFSKIDLVVAGFPCFTKGTLVTTSKGLKPIESIEQGDMVITHTNSFKPVVTPMSKIANHYNLVKIQGSHELKVTDEHPFFVRKMIRVWDYSLNKFVKSFSEAEWVVCKDLDVNHFVGVPINQNSISPEVSNDTDFWYTVGRCIADSCTSVTNLQNKVLNEEVMLAFGRGTENKEIPSFLLDAPVNIIKSFIDGYLSVNEHYIHKETLHSDKNLYKITTISDKLAYGFIQLVQKAYNVQPTITKTTVNQKPFFIVRFNKTKPKLAEYFVDKGQLWTPFKSKSRINAKIRVYNFEVQDDNSYAVNNLIVHNCQSWSIAGKQKGVDDNRGKLFWDMLEILKEIKKHNPGLHFLIENVKMKKDFEEYITSQLSENLCDVYKILINSALVSAQQRKRFYWSSWKVDEQPKDKKIVLKDVLESGVVNRDKSYCIDANYYKGANLEQYLTKCRRQLVAEKSNKIFNIGKGGQGNRVYSVEGKSITLSTASGGLGSNTGLFCINLPDGEYVVRKLTPVECERLQKFPDNYTEGISNTQRYRSLGNSFTVDVIAYLLEVCYKKIK